MKYMRPVSCLFSYYDINTFLFFLPSVFFVPVVVCFPTTLPFEVLDDAEVCLPWRSARTLVFHGKADDKSHEYTIFHMIYTPEYIFVAIVLLYLVGVLS